MRNVRCPGDHPDGRQLYVSAGGDIAHFTIGAAGNLTFAGCVGSTTGCTPVTPATALGAGTAITISPDGRQIYACDTCERSGS